MRRRIYCAQVRNHLYTVRCRGKTWSLQLTKYHLPTVEEVYDWLRPMADVVLNNSNPVFDEHDPQMLRELEAVVREVDEDVLRSLTANDPVQKLAVKYWMPDPSPAHQGDEYLRLKLGDGQVSILEPEVDYSICLNILTRNARVHNKRLLRMLAEAQSSLSPNLIIDPPDFDTGLVSELIGALHRSIRFRWEDIPDVSETLVSKYAMDTLHNAASGPQVIVDMIVPKGVPLIPDWG